MNRPRFSDHGFTGHCQRVKMFCAEARPRIAAELAEADENPLRGLHRRFELDQQGVRNPTPTTRR